MRLSHSLTGQALINVVLGELKYLNCVIVFIDSEPCV